MSPPNDRAEPSGVLYDRNMFNRPSRNKQTQENRSDEAEKNNSKQKNPSLKNIVKSRSSRTLFTFLRKVGCINQTKGRGWILSNSSPIRLIWDLFTMVVLLAICFVSPFQVAFFDEKVRLLYILRVLFENPLLII